jgi:diguanylate cyclase (GGDEF)-like protein
MDDKLLKNKPLAMVMALVLISLIGYLDLITGTALDLSIFYLLPIGLVSWYLGQEAGLTLCALAILVWTTVDYVSRAQPLALYLHGWNALVMLGYFLVVTMVFARLRIALEKEARLARVDFLTGIANRYDFNEFLFLEMERARRYHRPLTLAYLDCDDFNKVNEGFGHQQGDLLLREVANILKQNLRKVDQAARLAGDEFIAMLPETTEEEAREIFLRLHIKLLTVMELYQWPVTFSIGCVTFEDIPLSTKEAINEAQRMMRQAKENGKNQLATKTIHSFISKT